MCIVAWHWNWGTRRDKEEKVKGGRTGLPDRRDMSSKEESSDDGYFAQDSSEVPALGERDRFVCEGWQSVKIEGRAALPCWQEGCVEERVQFRQGILCSWQFRGHRRKIGREEIGRGREERNSVLPSCSYSIHTHSRWQTLLLFPYSVCCETSFFAFMQRVRFPVAAFSKQTSFTFNIT